MDTPEPDYRRHTEIIERLDRIERLVGSGELEMLTKRNEDLFQQNRRLNTVIGQAYEALEDMDDMELAREILLRKGDSG